MTASTLKTIVGRRLWITGLVIAIAAALVSALCLTASSQPASASIAQTASTLDTELSQDPTTSDAKADRASFHAAMKAARKLKGQERVDALKKVAADAKAGKYGDRIEKRAD